MSPSSGIIFRSKLSASFTNSSIATYRTTATRYASRFRGAPKTYTQGLLTTVSNPTQDNKQCEHTAPKLLDQTTPVPADHNPFIFLRGHWLSHDSARQAARQIHFEIPELCKRVVACCPGVNSIASWTKQDGHISRTLIFHTDNGKRLVVRLPTPAAGPAGRNVNSEVATIKYWLNMVEFAGGVIHLGLSNVANKNNFWTSKCSWQGVLEEHVSLLNHAHHVLRILANDPHINSISTPTMMPCATLKHVFVKPGEPETITCMTGWRACPISPLFLFCVNHTLDISNPYLTSGKTEFEADLLLYFDDVKRANASFPRRYIPRLSPFPPRVDCFGSDPTHDHPPDYEQLHGLFWCCHRTCADGIPVLQLELRRITESWRPLQLPGSCPYEHLTGKDLQRYEQRSKQSEEWDMGGKDVNFEVGVDELDHELILNDAWPGVLERLKKVSMSRYEEATGICDPPLITSGTCCQLLSRSIGTH
ncbi:hypothetical protein KCU78_g709, partial [Aureobasidium melanogenum]